MVICQGDVFWTEGQAARGSGPGDRRRCIVIQNDLYNRSRIRTVVVCALTSNLSRAEAPGNVRLDEGEANLPRASVVNVSQIMTLDKTNLTERIGRLTPARLRQVLEGVYLILEPMEVDEP